MLNSLAPTNPDDVDLAEIQIDDFVFKMERGVKSKVSFVKTDGEIIDLSVAENGNDVLRPCDVRFSEPKSAGRWLDALRPTTIDGGRTLTFKLNAYTANRLNAVKVQVLIAISC